MRSSFMIVSGLYQSPITTRDKMQLVVVAQQPLGSK